MSPNNTFPVHLLIVPSLGSNVVHHSQAIATEQTHPEYLAVACYFLESATALEGAGAPSALLKNLGLSHLHLVRSKLPDSKLLPPVPDVLHTMKDKVVEWPNEQLGWKAWSSLRFADAWGRFVAHRDARQDPQFDTIYEMYTAVTRKTTKQQTSRSKRSS